jgi:hypothetical protein
MTKDDRAGGGGGNGWQCPNCKVIMDPYSSFAHIEACKTKICCVDRMAKKDEEIAELKSKLALACEALSEVQVNMVMGSDDWNTVESAKVKIG